MTNLTELKRASWQCVHFISQAEYANLQSALVDEVFLVRELDSSVVVDDASLFSRVADALSFPDYFGDNWDSMDECLADLDVTPYIGVIFVFKHSTRVWSNAPLSAGRFLSAWQAAAQEWASGEVPFHLLFVT